MAGRNGSRVVVGLVLPARAAKQLIGRHIELATSCSALPSPTAPDIVHAFSRVSPILVRSLGKNGSSVGWEVERRSGRRSRARATEGRCSGGSGRSGTRRNCAARRRASSALLIHNVAGPRAAWPSASCFGRIGSSMVRATSMSPGPRASAATPSPASLNLASTHSQWHEVLPDASDPWSEDSSAHPQSKKAGRVKEKKKRLGCHRSVPCGGGASSGAHAWAKEKAAACAQRPFLPPPILYILLLSLQASGLLLSPRLSFKHLLFPFADDPLSAYFLATPVRAGWAPPSRPRQPQRLPVP